MAAVSSYHFLHGRWWANKKHSQKKICVGRNSWREVLLELPHEDTGLEALHFHGETKQFKIGLPLALSELPKQSIFQTIKGLIRPVADIK
jgi:hypothetical protein